jgi:hypothetical protein
LRSDGGQALVSPPSETIAELERRLWRADR